MTYCCMNNVLHGAPSAIVHPQVSWTNLSYFDNSDACSTSHPFYLARTAFWMGDFLGVGSADDDGLDSCVVHMAEEVGSSSVELISQKGSGKEGMSIRAVNLMMMCWHLQRDTLTGTSPLSSGSLIVSVAGLQSNTQKSVYSLIIFLTLYTFIGFICFLVITTLIIKMYFHVNL